MNVGIKIVSYLLNLEVEAAQDQVVDQIDWYIILAS